MRNGVLVPSWFTFPQAPLRSRTVGFPESGSGLGSARHLSATGLPVRSKAEVLAHIHPTDVRSACLLVPTPSKHIPGTVSENSWGHRNHRVPRAPLPGGGRYPQPGQPRGSPQRTLLLLPRSYGLMRQTISLHTPRLTLGAVFAGCCKSLLDSGLSRHYLCHPCVGAWTHTAPCPSGALTHFFPNDNGLTSRQTRSTHEITPAKRLRQGAYFRGCSHSITFRRLHSLDLQIAPTAVLRLGGQAVYTTHRPAGYPDRDVVSLPAQNGQLTGLDFHQLDGSLVGCSFPHPAFTLSIRPSPSTGRHVASARHTGQASRKDACPESGRTRRPFVPHSASTSAGLSARCTVEPSHRFESPAPDRSTRTSRVTGC